MLLDRGYRLALVMLFFVAIVTPAIVSLLVPQPEISHTERRKLAPWPRVPPWNIAEFPRQYESWYDDHFGLRRPLIRWFNRINVGVFGVSNSEYVLIGRDGWLFQGGHPHVSDIRNDWPFSPGELRHWSDVQAAKYAWLKERGIGYLFVIAPNKHLVYPEKLPAGLAPVRSESRVDQLLAQLQAQTRVPVLDLRGVLQASRERLRPYHMTDTHWNDYGAYVAYREIMHKLEGRIPGIPIVTLKDADFIRREAPGGDLAQNLEMAESLPEIYIEPRQPVIRCANSPELGPRPSEKARHENDFTTTCETGRYRALIFRDSYALALMPYLSESFAYIHYVRHSPVRLRDMQRLVDEYKPDVVIEQRASRWLRSPEG